MNKHPKSKHEMEVSLHYSTFLSFFNAFNESTKFNELNELNESNETNESNAFNAFNELNEWKIFGTELCWHVIFESFHSRIWWFLLTWKEVQHWPMQHGPPLELFFSWLLLNSVCVDLVIRQLRFFQSKKSFNHLIGAWRRGRMLVDDISDWKHFVKLPKSADSTASADWLLIPA